MAQSVRNTTQRKRNRVFPFHHLLTFVEECATKQLNEYKVKLQKADQEIATLQATVNFLQNQQTTMQFAVFVINR